MKLIFGTDGIRGRFNKKITYSLAFKQNNGSNVAGVRIHGSNFQTVIMLEEFSA